MAELIPIADAEDPRVAAYRDIRERDLVGREGQFIAEGEVVLRVLADHRGDLIQSLLIDGRRLDKLAPILAALPQATPVYVTEQGALDAIAGFHLHRGLLALGEKPANPSADDLLAAAGDGPVLAMMGIANHDNMGGLFRNAAAFGVNAALLASDCCDPFYRKALRVSVGGVLRVPFATLAPDEDLVAALERSGFTPIALSPAGATPLHEFKPPCRPALIMGAEGPGLPETVLARCRTVSIPMAAGFDSLNVAVTAGIALHHLVMHHLVLGARAD